MCPFAPSFKIFNSGTTRGVGKVPTRLAKTRIGDTHYRGGATDREQLVPLELLGLGRWLMCRSKGIVKIYQARIDDTHYRR